MRILKPLFGNKAFQKRLSHKTTVEDVVVLLGKGSDEAKVWDSLSVKDKTELLEPIVKPLIETYEKKRKES